jgi:DNA (cytosine-5)-methyltransferase 1
VTAARRERPAGSHHRPWSLSEERRAAYRRSARAAHLAKRRALSGTGPEPIHEINVPRLHPERLIPGVRSNGLRALSLFSGGGGLDLGFDRAGYEHVASYDVLPAAGDTLRACRPDWTIHSGPESGDVASVAWRRYRGAVDVLHGAAPCQPFSVAGRQRGSRDTRDMLAHLVEAVLAVRPVAFVTENVPALGGPKFTRYLRRAFHRPLGESYEICEFELEAESYGVPQRRRRRFWVGLRRSRRARFTEPRATHLAFGSDDVAACMGARAALGLPDIERDGVAPTVRSPLTGPRHTTSVVNSASAVQAWANLEIWPHGVAPTRDQARAFVTRNRHFRLSVADVAVLQGFPESWSFSGPTYMALGQIGNAVPPPVAYALARSLADALS